MRHWKLGVSAAVLAWAACESGAFAQTADAGKASDQGLPEIVVTATKRTENLREVPISISVLSGDQLEKQHITDFSDIARALPSVGFTAGQSLGGSGPGLSNIQIRGISSSAGEATVGIYLDDVPMIVKNIYAIGATEPKFFDIDQIDVLRGPQGTLYGASSMGGTIRITTKQPNLDKIEGAAYAEISGTENGGLNYQTNGVVNYPIVPGKLAIRIGAQTGRDEGYIDQYNLILDDNESPSRGALRKSGINSNEWNVAKLTLKAQVNDDLAITPSIFYQHMRSGDTNTASPFLGTNQIAKTTAEPGVDTIVVPSLTAKYDAGFADLTAVSSYFYRSFIRTQDGQSANSEYFPFLTVGTSTAFNTALANLPSQIYLNSKVRQFTEELRLASKPYTPGAFPITWLAGVYYSDQHFNFSDTEPVPGIGALFAANGLTFPGNIPNIDPSTGLVSTDPNFYFPNDLAYESVRHYDERQRAVFGEVGYNVLPELKVSAGLRYISARQSLARWGNYFFTPGPDYETRVTNNNALTPKFSITYDISPENTVYATASKGYRLGGANRPIPVGLCGTTPSSYAPDKLWNYEVGDKARFLDNRVSVNASAFLIRWKNIQQEISLPCTFNFETNTGNADSYGVELEIKGKVTQNLTLGIAGGPVHTVLSSTPETFNAFLAASGNPNTLHSGDYVAGVPKWSAIVTGEYNFNITDEIGGFARADMDFTGDSHGSVFRNNADYDRPSYYVLNASAGAQYGDWEFSVFGKNLLNEQKILQTPNVEFVPEAYRLRPVTVGVSASTAF
jgi:iron complex outermembrane receptor protein